MGLPLSTGLDLGLNEILIVLMDTDVLDLSITSSPSTGSSAYNAFKLLMEVQSTSLGKKVNNQRD